MLRYQKNNSHTGDLSMKKYLTKLTTAVVGAGVLLLGISGTASSNNASASTNNVSIAKSAAKADLHYSDTYGTITRKGYTIWQDSTWKKSLHSSTNWYHHSIQVSSSTTKNGNLYYRLSKDGKYFGMINSDAVKLGTGKAGAAIATNKYVTISKKNYNVWHDFSWSRSLHSTTNWYNHTFQVKYTYFHNNGSIYYSLYQNGKWFGYLSSTATTTAKGAQGKAISTNKYVKLTSKGYTVWGDFNWKNKLHSTSNWYNHVFQVKTMYYHNNGTLYYSLYQNGKWFGYLASSATKTTTKPVVKKATTPKKTVAPNNGDTRTVYIAPESGRKYHFDRNCRGLTNADRVVTMTLGEARAEGYTLCGWED